MMKNIFTLFFVFVAAGCVTPRRQVVPEAEGMVRFHPSPGFEGIEVFSLAVNGRCLAKGSTHLSIPASTATNITAVFMLGNAFPEMVFLKWRVSDVKTAPFGAYWGNGDADNWGIQTYQQLYGANYTGLRPPRDPRFNENACSSLVHSGDARPPWDTLSITYVLHVDYYVKGDHNHYVSEVPVSIRLTLEDTEQDNRGDVR